jgi:hypothetical protein
MDGGDTTSLGEYSSLDLFTSSSFTPWVTLKHVFCDSVFLKKPSGLRPLVRQFTKSSLISKSDRS